MGGMTTTPPPPPTKLDLIATSTFGLEAVVARELRSLGYARKSSNPGGCSFRR